MLSSGRRVRCLETPIERLTGVLSAKLHATRDSAIASEVVCVGQVVDTEAAEAGLPSAADHDADVRPFHHRWALAPFSRNIAPSASR